MHQRSGTWVLVLACLLAAGTATAQPQGQAVRVKLERTSAGEPALRSSAALVLDATGSSVLYARRSNVAMPIASITKLMTALVVMEAGLQLDETIEIGVEDASHRRGDLSRLTPGTELT